MLVVHSMWWQLQYGTLRDEIDRRRLERAAAARSDAGAAHELIAFVYAGHSDWDTPNYAAELRACRPPAPTPRACSRSRSRRCCVSPAPPTSAARRAAAPGSNSWAVAGIHTRSGVGADRQRHASRPRRAGRVVSGAPARHRRPDARHHRRHAAGHARGRGRIQRPGGLGIHQQLRRLRRCALGQVRERRLSRAPRAHRGEGRRRRRSRLIAMSAKAWCSTARNTRTTRRAANACRPRGWRRGPRPPTSGCSALERARNIDDVLALAPQRRHSRAEHGRRRYARPHRLDLVRPRAARATGPDRLFGRARVPRRRRSSAHRRSAGGAAVDRESARRRRDRSKRCSATTKWTWAQAATTSARARGRSATICWASRIRPPRPTCSPSSSMRARCSWRAGAICCWRSSTKMRCTTRRCAASFATLVSEGAAEASPDAVGYRLVRTFRSNTLNAMWRSLVTGLLGEEGRCAAAGAVRGGGLAAGQRAALGGGAAGRR